jgi:hypothetical protein
VSGAGRGWAELLAAAERIRTAAIERSPGLATSMIHAIGWATVDADRARRELDELLGPASWVPVGREPLLGARAWRRGPGAGAVEAPELLVLEPDTEGRLAAFLARFGEGVAAVYLRATAGAGAAGTISDGIVPGAPAWGPHAVVLGER